MHGPCDDADGIAPLHWCPRFGPDIRLVDDIAKTIRPLHRLIWRTARDKAIERWSAAGISFAVEEGPGAMYNLATDDLTLLLIPETIRLVRAIDSPEPGPEDFAAWVTDDDASIAVYTPHPEWWRRYYLPAVIGTVTHEIGHCLGLSHRSDGGVMAGGWKPDVHDLDSIRAYYVRS